MKFEANAKDLSGAVNFALKSIKRSHIPILECVKIDAKDNRVTVIGTDNEVQALSKVSASVTDVGYVCVNGAMMSSALKAASGNVSLAVDGNELVIKSGSFSASLPISDEEYPKTARPENMTEIENGVDAYMRCLPSVSTEETRYYLNGVCFGGEFAYATDGACMRRVPSRGGNRQIVPGSAAGLIQSVPGGRLFLGEYEWMVEGEGRVCSGRLIGGVFPDADRIIPADQVTTWECDASDLIGAIDAVCIGDVGKIFLSGSDKIVVSGERFNAPKSIAEMIVDASGTGSSVTMGIKPIKSALTGLSGKISISVTGGGSPVVVTMGGEYLAVVMPLRDERNA